LIDHQLKVSGRLNCAHLDDGYDYCRPETEHLPAGHRCDCIGVAKTSVSAGVLSDPGHRVVHPV
jgi:hypothetical protein